MLSDRDIQRIVSRIVDACRPIAAGTFGSYAVGLARESSDLDLFVIQRTTLPNAARRRAIYQHLFGVMHPLDVHVFTPEEFEVDAREELSFAWLIAKQACLYHWTAEAERQVPALARSARLPKPATVLKKGCEVSDMR
jgi:predicted nucleotidyltransferase